MEVEEYESFLKTYMGWKAQEILKTNPALKSKNYSDFRAEFQVAVQIFTDAIVRSEMLYAIMHSLLAECSIKGLDDLMESFRANCTNQEYVRKIEEMYNNDKKIQEKSTIQVYKTVDGVALDAPAC